MKASPTLWKLGFFVETSILAGECVFGVAFTVVAEAGNVIWAVMIVDVIRVATTVCMVKLVGCDGSIRKDVVRGSRVDVR